MNDSSTSIATINDGAHATTKVNLTPHVINVWANDGTHVVDIPSSGTVARLAVKPELVRVDGGIPIYVGRVGDIVGLPAEVAGVSLIVSGAVRSALPGRKDLFSPGELIRNDAGNPIGCLGLFSN